MNIDQSEVKKFESGYNDWHNPKGKFRSLHAINDARFSFINELAHLKDKTVLDIGCGGGILSSSLAQASALVDGIDTSSKAIAAAQQHAALIQIDINYKCASVEDILTTHKESYDIICCLEVIEHVPSPQKLVLDALSLLKPNGYIFVATINRNLYSFLTAIVGAEYIFRILPINTHSYSKLVTPQELNSYLNQGKANVIDKSGMFYNTLSHQARLVKNMWGNYIMCAQKQ